MTTFLISLVPVAVVAALIYYVITSRRKKLAQKVEDSFPIDVSLPATCVYTTPKGAQVRRINPLAETDKAPVLAAVDAAFDRLFERTRDFGYSSHRAHSDFCVVMYPPTYFTQAEHLPALTMRNGQTVAGTCIGLENPTLAEPFILVAENTEFLDYLTESVYNESEHFALFYNDRAAFYRFTGANDIHPIFGVNFGA